MNLDDALSNVTTLGVDTAPLIYFVEKHPLHGGIVRSVLSRVDTGVLQACSSVITLTEVLTQPLQLGNVALVSAYRELLLGSRNFEIVPVDAAVAERAAEMRARFHLRNRTPTDCHGANTRVPSILDERCRPAARHGVAVLLLSELTK